MIAVMHEKALGSKSKWGPYLSFLPQDLSHMIIYWTVGAAASILHQQLSPPHWATLKYSFALGHKAVDLGDSCTHHIATRWKF